MIPNRFFYYSYSIDPLFNICRVRFCKRAELIGPDTFIDQMRDDKSRFHKHGKPVDHRFILSNIALNSPKQNNTYYRAIDKRRPIKGASV